MNFNSSVEKTYKRVNSNQNDKLKAEKQGIYCYDHMAGE
jgi:hypothetical protein